MNYISRVSKFCVQSAFAMVFACLLAAGTALATPADDFKEASRLYQQGRLDQAMSKVNAGLQSAPKDPQGRFLKGLILTEQKKTNEAIQVFTGITEDFPELPEPYNNLAVLYASQGNYDKAKAALELAIQTHPAYATAHENLGDIYAQLAPRAYDKALQLDKTNSTAQAKLSMVREMFSQPKSVSTAAAKPAGPGATPSAAPPATTAAAPATPAASSTTPATSAAPTGPATAASATPATEEGARATVLAWVRAWSARNVPAYVSYYAADFQTPDGLSRGAWEAQRKERIERQRNISVDVQFRSVKVSGNEATVVFRQAYRADTVKSDNTKTIKLVRAGDKWLIQVERAGG